MDVLKQKWPSDLSHIIANLPYQISSPVLDLIQQYHYRSPLKVIVILVQDEFAERMSMDHFGSLSPLGLSLWLDFDVKKGAKSFSNRTPNGINMGSKNNQKYDRF